MNLLLDLAAHPVIGHRGAAAHAPENTLAGFSRALELGAEALELDVRLAACGEVVVCHDPTLDRTTDLTGPVGARTAAELRRADAGFHFSLDQGRTFPWRGRGVGVPTLREVIAHLPSVPLLLEVKEVEVAEPLARVLLDTGAWSRAVLAGADWRALRPFGTAPFLLGASQRDIARLYFRLGRPEPGCRTYAVPGRWHGLTIPSSRFCRAARALGATVHAWTVDDGVAAGRLWALGVNGIVTNRPDQIRLARQRAGL